MQVTVYKTCVIKPFDSLHEIIDQSVPLLQENDILVITSKIVSLCEGAIVSKETNVTKQQLIRQSADAYLNVDSNCYLHGIEITIKNHILIPSAGIDESNGNGVYILYPENIQASAIKIWDYIRLRDGLKHVGVLITDSHTTPMRRGVTGIGLGWCGFKALYSYIGKPDCFKQHLKVTMVNILDALSVSAVFCMGEGDEQTPIAVIKDAPRIEFQERVPSTEELKEIIIPLNEDLYAPLLQNDKWVFKNLENSQQRIL